MTKQDYITGYISCTASIFCAFGYENNNNCAEACVKVESIQVTIAQMSTCSVLPSVKLSVMLFRLLGKTQIRLFFQDYQ